MHLGEGAFFEVDGCYFHSGAREAIVAVQRARGSVGDDDGSAIGPTIPSWVTDRC